jgi:hypothetical protein
MLSCLEQFETAAANMLVRRSSFVVRRSSCGVGAASARTFVWRRNFLDVRTVDVH